MGPAPVPPFLHLVPDRIVVRCPDSYPQYVRANVCLARLDGSGGFRLMSAAWEKQLGYRKGELHGRSLLDLLPPGERSVGRAALQRLLSPAEADPVALELRRKDGGVLLMHCHRRFDPYDASLFVAAEPAAVKAGPDPAPSGRDPA